MTASGGALESQGADDSVSRLTGPIVRSWPVVVLLVVYGLFLGAILPNLRPLGYTATTEVLLRPVIADPVVNQRVDQLVSLDTEAVVVGSDEVLSKAAAATGLNAADLRRHLKVGAVPTSQVLRVSQTQKRSETARRAAKAIADTYLEQRQERARSLVAKEDESITAQIASTDAKLNDLSGQVIAAPAGSAARASLQSLQTSTAQQLSALQTRSFALQRAQIDSGEVLRVAGKTAITGFSRSTTVPAGALIGLLAGLVLAILFDRLSLAIRRPADAVRATGRRILATVNDGRLDSALGPDDVEEPEATAYRRVLLALEPDEAAVVAVLGVLGGLGGGYEASTVSRGLATVAARGGSNVALLLLDPADGDEDELGGATDLRRVLGEAPADAAAPASTDVGSGRLTVYVGEPSLEVLATPFALSSAAAQLRARHDLVVVAVDDLADSALAEGWIRCADRTVLAARLRHTRTGRLRAAVAHLDEAGCPPTGTVLIN